MLDFLAKYIPGAKSDWTWLTTVIVSQSHAHPAYDLEVCVYADAWVELSMNGGCFKSYHSDPNAVAEPCGD